MCMSRYPHLPAALLELLEAGPESSEFAFAF